MTALSDAQAAVTQARADLTAAEATLASIAATLETTAARVQGQFNFVQRVTVSDFGAFNVQHRNPPTQADIDAVNTVLLAEDPEYVINHGF